MTSRSSGQSNLQELPGLPTLEPPPSPSFPTFPTLAELIEETPQTRSSKDLGLFKAFMWDVRYLMRDMEERGDHYDDQTKTLVRTIMSGQKNLKELSSEEMELLDKAVLVWAQPSPKKPTATENARAPTRRSQPRPDLGMPESDMPAFWWLR